MNKGKYINPKLKMYGDKVADKRCEATSVLFLMNFHEKSEMKHRSFDLKISAKNILFNC